MSRQSQATVGVFTTQKLQALLDSRCHPEAVSRAGLARAMSQAGSPISVHGIDGWFRPQDSNYGIERTSLERGRRTYPLPKRRWRVLLDLFSLSLEDLDCTDADFRRWCFARIRRASSVADGPPAPRIVLLHAPCAIDEARGLAEHLETGGIGVARIARAGDERDESDDRIARQLRSSQLLLIRAGGQPTDEEDGLRNSLDLAADLRLPVLWNGIAPDSVRTRGIEILPETIDSGTVATVIQCRVRDRRQDATSTPAPWPVPEPVTDRPSIAVLPLVNLTRDDETAMLAESLTEDITTLLSRIPEFFVIAHSTMRTYRDAHPDRDTLCRQLGVRYLLEGSLRTDGETLRVTTELIDAGSGASLFGQRFDRPMTDLFRVQDEITTAICAQLEPRVRVEDIAYGARQGSVSSWRLWQEGWYWLFIDAPQPSPDRSLQRFRRAVELEPDYALGHAGLAIALSTALLWGGLGRDALEEAREHAGIASRLLPENPVVLYAMAMISFVGPDSLEIPLEYVERAVELEPSNAMYQGVRGYLLANLGRAREGVECCLHAMRLSPKDAREPFLCYMLGGAYVANEQYELAIETMTRCRRFSEVDFIWLIIAFSHAQLGERDRAIASLKRIIDPRPYGFYRWAVRESLWLGLPEREKEDFLSLLPRAGIE
jgi:TolB-like protein/tetratricopeptide (TPR) repeat protein